MLILKIAIIVIFIALIVLIHIKVYKYWKRKSKIAVFNSFKDFVVSSRALYLDKEKGPYEINEIEDLERIAEIANRYLHHYKRKRV